MPVELDQEVLEGFCDNTYARGNVRVPKGVKIVKDSFNFEESNWFADEALTWGAVNVSLPASFEKFDGVCWNYNAQWVADHGAANSMFTFKFECDNSEAEAKYTSMLEDSTVTTAMWQNPIKPFWTGFIAAQIYTAAVQEAWGAAGFIPVSYQAVVDAGY